MVINEEALTSCPVCRYSIETHREQEKKFPTWSPWDEYKPLVKWIGPLPAIECQNCGFFVMNGQPDFDVPRHNLGALIEIWNGLVKNSEEPQSHASLKFQEGYMKPLYKYVYKKTGEEVTSRYRGCQWPGSLLIDMYGKVYEQYGGSLRERSDLDIELNLEGLTAFSCREDD